MLNHLVYRFRLQLGALAENLYGRRRTSGMQFPGAALSVEPLRKSCERRHVSMSSLAGPNADLALI
jgi:hypothetical protein